MRFAIAVSALIVLGTAPAPATVMRQSPALMRKAGAACAPGRYRGPQRGAGYRYGLGACAPNDR